MESIEDVIQMLRNYRENSTRDPETIRDVWPRMKEIEQRVSIEEKWTIYEQFCMAAIDLHDKTIKEACLSRLQKQFPQSIRVKILYIMAKYESVGNYEEAIQEYDDILEDDPTNTMARKRKIAILISQRKNVDAIKELCDYLKKFMNDQEAWKELCDLYITEQDYPKAIFCMEELLLSNPISHIYNTRLAELCYTLGTHESLEQARSYYSQALRIEESNARALHGLHLTLKHLLSGNKLTAQQRKEYEKQSTWCKTTVNALYDKFGNENIAKYMKL